MGWLVDAAMELYIIESVNSDATDAQFDQILECDQGHMTMGGSVDTHNIFGIA